jgi:hypothetical protein
MTRLPRLFIGSSKEGLDVAYAIQENLEYDAEATVWTQNIFSPSEYALKNLLGAMKAFDFSALVFTPDDVVRIRGQEDAAIRDNVVFEFGLFVGALGLARCFCVVPRDARPLRIPTDLLGLAPLTFRSQRFDRNLVAALGTACNQMRRAFRASASDAVRGPSLQEPIRVPSLQEYVDKWAALEETRARVRELPLDPYDEWPREDFKKIFVFLESLSDAILAGTIDESAARLVFEKAILSTWPVAASLLAPPNHRDEWWDPPPRIAQLYIKWSA